MAPSATGNPLAATEERAKGAAAGKTQAFKTLDHGSIVPTDEVLPEVRTDHREPLKLSGALDKFESFDVTPIIGREFVNVDLVDLLRAPNSDELIRDLAITSKHQTHPLFPLHPS
jgi:hypothetical protein